MVGGKGAQTAWLHLSSAHSWLEGLRLPVSGKQGLNRLGVWLSQRDNGDDVFEAGLMVADHEVQLLRKKVQLRARSG